MCIDLIGLFTHTTPFLFRNKQQNAKKAQERAVIDQQQTLAQLIKWCKAHYGACPWSCRTMWEGCDGWGAADRRSRAGSLRIFGRRCMYSSTPTPTPTPSINSNDPLTKTRRGHDGVDAHQGDPHLRGGGPALRPPRRLHHRHNTVSHSVI